MTLPPNTRPILERLAYAIYLLLLVGSIGVTGLGWIIGCATGDFRALWLACGGLALSRWLHVHGHAHWHFRECEDSFDVPGSPGFLPRSDVEEARAADFGALLAQFESEADVWRRGELRREIAARLARAPTLREEFATVLAEHPEL